MTDQLAADLFRLHEAGATTLPAAALAHAAAAVSLHRHRDRLDTVAALVQHDAPRAVGELLGLVQDGVAATALACDAAGRALVLVARRYAEVDGRTATDFEALLRERALRVPDGAFHAPPRSTDPAFGDLPLHGPRDAA